MPHTACEPGSGGSLTDVREVWATLLSPDADLTSKMEALFETETAEFGLEHAFFTRIDVDEGTQRFEVAHSPDGAVAAGETAPLSESYCRKVVADPSGTLTVSDAAAEGWTDDPAYRRFGFGSYLGTTVTVEDELFGTLCFANGEPRDEPLVAGEAALVEMYGEWATYELNQWAEPPPPEKEGGGVQDVPPSRVDAMLDALCKEMRRHVLLALLDDEPADVVDAVERASDRENVEVQLHHTHLPKLQAAGFVEWDREAERVSRGSNFGEVEPVLRVLKGYSTPRQR